MPASDNSYTLKNALAAYFSSKQSRAFIAAMVTLLLMAMLLPIANIIFIYPAFTDVLIKGVEDDAQRLGHHMMPGSLKHTQLTRASLNQRFFGNIYKLENDYGLLKVKIYSAKGEVIYSTSAKEVGAKHTDSFFFDHVGAGKPHSKLVSKHSKTMEGVPLKIDVIETYVPYMRGNTFLGAFEMYYDVTDRKKRLDQLVTYSRVAMYTLSFFLFLAAVILFIKEVSGQQAKAKARQLKKEVESITRHDLKTPLISILSGIEYLEQFTELDKDQTSVTADMRIAANTSMEMINRSLDLYKMETGNYQFQPMETDIIAATQRAINALSSMAFATGAKVLFTCDGAIPRKDTTFHFMTEETLFYSLTANLLKNAIEASTNGDQITINLSHKEGLHLTIHNPAMVPEEIQDIFFEKLATAGKHGGTGLGTYSARLITHTMGGTIDMTTSNDDGTLITITLPIPSTQD